MANEGTTTVTTPTFKVSYPSVFKAKLNSLSKKMEYSVEALFDKKADITQLKAAAKAAAIKKWGLDEKKWPKFTNNPFKDQTDKINDLKEKNKPFDHLVEGAVYMTFKCQADKAKPKVVDQNLQEILEESKFYGGCYARASVNAYAYDQGKNVGISFGLNLLQFVGDGEPFSGRPSVEQAFEPIAQDEATSAGVDMFK